MITGLLLLPVATVLVWLYWILLPDRRWVLLDTFLLAGVVLLVAIYIHVAGSAEYEGAGPMYPEIVSMAGSYGILLAGLAVGLWWRRRG
jgi:hypothetical protein